MKLLCLAVHEKDGSQSILKNDRLFWAAPASFASLKGAAIGLRVSTGGACQPSPKPSFRVADGRILPDPAAHPVTINHKSLVALRQAAPGRSVLA
jgi:hypothetical protein